MIVTPNQPDKPHTLLLVDDEENILASLRRLFRRDGYRVLCATSGQEGLVILSREPDVDVIMSDQRMPQMTGTAFLSQARQLSPNSVRIVLSGYTDLESVTDAINEGAVYKFLTKPWDDEILRLSIREALQHKWAMDENRMLQSMLVEVNAEFASSIERLTRELEQVHQQGLAFQAAFDAELEPMLLASHTGRLLAANPTARALFGLGAEELPGTLEALLPGADTGVLPDRLSIAAGTFRCLRKSLGDAPEAPISITLLREAA